ncbi:unnamed protein product [Rodentolepis nana]|uniref:FHA domain-containing protein n=1 Tax=Rodentolepis nana TaxID=102285 RepID=A0A0R3TBC8_RODNA|nr:unnamed protein product [Rodentolepis nana]
MERGRQTKSSSFRSERSDFSELYLIWVGDFEKDERFARFHAQFDRNDFEPKTMSIHTHRNHISMGSKYGNPFGHYQLNSTLCSCLIDPQHATIRREPNGSFRLLDHSQSGTFVNYRRISNFADLSHGDIICFGHPDSTGIKRGKVVEPYYWDLKYKAFIGAQEDVLLKIGEALNKEEIDRTSVSLSIQLVIAMLEYEKLNTDTD